MKKLVQDDTVLFDEECYTNIESEDSAFNYVRYYSRKVSEFRAELMGREWSHKDADAIIDLLWGRVIAGCRKFRVPLTMQAESVAKRLNI